ncbi:MAG: putative lipid II flippase FtsW [Bdellovibrionaceae bacterium]|nr:putative lipid II flippase FtsW [Pseudobdellovibrionaceae bacterium]
MRKSKSFSLDKGLFLSFIFFIFFGLVHIYSSSYIFALEKYGNPLYFFNKQVVFTLVSLVVFYITIKLPWQVVVRFSSLAFFIILFLLALTLVPSIGVKVGGARRWLSLPLFNIEPVEFFKIIMVFYFARLLSFKDWMENKKTIAIQVGLFFTPLIILLLQPDFGSVVIYLVVFFALLFVSPIKLRWILLSVVTALVSLFTLIIIEPYRLKRLQAVLDPWSDPYGKGFQLIQSLLAFYSGSWLGKGLGEGQSKLFFLPEAHTDFTLAVLGEEIGFVGVSFFISLYTYIIYKGFVIAYQSKDIYQSYVATGLTVVFGLGVYLNIAIELGLLPPKGLSLAFLSYGGSHLLANSIIIAILLNIDKATKKARYKKAWG